MVVEPLGELGLLDGAVAAGFLQQVKADDFRQPRAGDGQLLRKLIELAVALVTDNQPLLGVEHGETTHHVVERDLEPRVELLK